MEIFLCIKFFLNGLTFTQSTLISGFQFLPFQIYDNEMDIFVATA